MTLGQQCPPFPPLVQPRSAAELTNRDRAKQNRESRGRYNVFFSSFLLCKTEVKRKDYFSSFPFRPSFWKREELLGQVLTAQYHIHFFQPLIFVQGREFENSHDLGSTFVHPPSAVVFGSIIFRPKTLWNKCSGTVFFAFFFNSSFFNSVSGFG